VPRRTLRRAIADPLMKRSSFAWASSVLEAASVRQKRCAMKWFRDSTAPFRFAR